MGVRQPIITYTLASITGSTAATGVTGGIQIRESDFDNLTFSLSVPSISATATLDVWVQTSDNGGNTWYDMMRFPRVTASAANPWRAVNMLGGSSMIGTIGACTLSSTAGGMGSNILSQWIQVQWALGGTTPSATFTLIAENIGVSRGVN